MSKTKPWVLKVKDTVEEASEEAIAAKYRMKYVEQKRQGGELNRSVEGMAGMARTRESATP